MKKNELNYDKLYYDTFEEVFQNRLTKLKVEFNNMINIFSDSKITKLNNELYREYVDLLIDSESKVTNQYLKDLTDAYTYKEVYISNPVQSFLENEFPPLKVKHENRKIIIANNPKESDEYNAVVFIATFNALKTIHRNVSDIQNAKTKSDDEIFKLIEFGKEQLIIEENDFEDFSNQSDEYHVSDKDTEEGRKLKREFTMPRQVLAMHYIFEELEVRGIDITNKAKFVQFLTGRQLNAKNIMNTNIYKKLKKPLPLSDKKLIDDLQFIRSYFERLGLAEIAAKISTELSKRS